MTAQEPKMVGGESNEINGEKIDLYGIKNCTFKLGVEKNLITKKNHSLPPPIKWSAPNTVTVTNK